MKSSISHCDLPRKSVSTQRYRKLKCQIICMISLLCTLGLVPAWSRPHPIDTWVFCACSFQQDACRLIFTLVRGDPCRNIQAIEQQKPKQPEWKQKENAEKQSRQRKVSEFIWILQSAFPPVLTAMKSVHTILKPSYKVLHCEATG